MDSDDLEDFVENDMKNVVELFEVFNEGTHGTAGTFDLGQLRAVRKRVEDGIMFLSRICACVVGAPVCSTHSGRVGRRHQSQNLQHVLRFS